MRSIENVEVSRDAYSVANDAILQQREGKWAEILNTLKGQSVSELNELISDPREVSYIEGLASSLCGGLKTAKSWLSRPDKRAGKCDTASASV